MPCPSSNARLPQAACARRRPAAAGLLWLCSLSSRSCNLLPAFPQAPNAESRAAVQGGKPLTPAGQVVLDPEPDVREVRQPALFAAAALL